MDDVALPKPCLGCGIPTRNGTRCRRCQALADAKRDAERGTAAQRGYGKTHRQTRARLLAAWKPGDPCAHCGQAMLDKSRLDLAHTQDRSGYRGLAHDVCNRGNR
jgi:hypothetical protein